MTIETSRRRRIDRFRGRASTLTVGGARVVALALLSAAGGCVGSFGPPAETAGDIPTRVSNRTDASTRTFRMTPVRRDGEGTNWVGLAVVVPSEWSRRASRMKEP